MTVAFIGLGANLPSAAGSPEATLAAARDCLGRLGRVVVASSLYSTEPVGFANQPRFVNAVLALETELEPRRLLEELLAMEREFGRDRTGGVRNGPRTLDLDLLLYGDVRLHEPGLEIPHPRIGERAFVLVPLGEIARDGRIFTLGKKVTEYLHTLQLSASGRTHGVFPLQSGVWRAGPVDGGSSSARPDADHADGGG